MRLSKLIRICNKKRYEGGERRQKPRICSPIPIKIRAKEIGGRRIEFDVQTDDLSAGGFRAHAKGEFKPGQKLFFILRFSSSGKDLRATTVAAYGTVLRSERQKNGTCVFASTMDRHRFIWSLNK